MAPRICSLRGLFSLAVLAACYRGVTGIDLTLGFIKEPEDLVAKRNQPATLACSGFSASEYGPVNYTWYHKNVLVNDGRRVVLANGSLHFRRVRYRKHGSGNSQGNTDGDAGVYQCALSNSAGSLLSRPAILSVSNMARKFNLDPESAVVEEGDVVRLRCQIQAVPMPMYSWQRNGQTLSSQDDARFLIYSNGVLQIIGVAVSDAGKYKCVAHGDEEHGEDSAEADLQVLPASNRYRAPMFLKTNVTLVQNVGESALLECMASGYPRPTISWSRPDGKVIRQSVARNEGQGNLALESLLMEDDGEYVCTATNKHPGTLQLSSVTQTLKLDMRMPPDFLKRPRSVEGAMVQTVRFECDVQGVPHPSVTWLKNGQPVETSGRVKLKNSSSNELVIVLTISADSGIYQCVAENSAGYASAAARYHINASRDQPDPPMGLRAETLSSTSILLTWNASLARNGLPIQAYTVHCVPTEGGDEHQRVSVNTSQVVDRLRPYTNYTFYIRTYNGRSASEQSETIIWTTDDDVPLSAPSITLTSLSTSLLVSWEELPANRARGAIVSYKIQWRRRSHASYNVVEAPGDVHEYTITGLFPKKKYDVRVMGATKKGYPVLNDNEWPWVTHEMPENSMNKVPLPPNLHLTVVNASVIEVKWKMPDENEFEVHGYKLSYRKQTHKLRGPIVLLPNATQYLLTELIPHTWYEVHIQAFNEHGDGRESMRVISTFPDTQNPLADSSDPHQSWSVVEPPSHLEAEPISPSSIYLMWKAPVTSRNISYFTVRYNPAHPTNAVNASMVSYIRSTSREVVITDLTPYTLYEFSVRSHDQDNKQGPYSRKVECKTLEDVPTSPQGLTWKPLDATTVRVNWQAPKYPNGVITNYYVLYNTEMDSQSHLEKWLSKEESGTDFSALLNGLSSNTMYYVCVRARTRAGAGTPSEVITLNIPVVHIKNHSNPQAGFNSELDDSQLGIIVGVTIGVSCIIICALIIVCKNRCFPPTVDHVGLRSHHCGNGYVPHSNGNGNGHVPREYRISSSESREMDSLAPMLTHIPDTSTGYLDTKGGYVEPYFNGRQDLNGGGPRGVNPSTITTISSSTPRLPNGNAPRVNGNSMFVNITENPQFDTSGIDGCAAGGQRKSTGVILGGAAQQHGHLHRPENGHSRDCHHGGHHCKHHHDGHHHHNGKQQRPASGEAKHGSRSGSNSSECSLSSNHGASNGVNRHSNGSASAGQKNSKGSSGSSHQPTSSSSSSSCNSSSNACKSGGRRKRPTSSSSPPSRHRTAPQQQWPINSLSISTSTPSQHHPHCAPGESASARNTHRP